MLNCIVEYNYMCILAALGTFLALTLPQPKINSYLYLLNLHSPETLICTYILDQTLNHRAPQWESCFESHFNKYQKQISFLTP